MPGLSGRMSTLIKAKISKMLDRAEDPAETLEYSYQKQIELLQNVKKGIADVVTSKKRLQLQEEQLRQQVGVQLPLEQPGKPHQDAQPGRHQSDPEEPPLVRQRRDCQQ